MFEHLKEFFNSAFKDTESTEDIEKQKIDNMSVEEYNQYLSTEKDREFRETKKYFEKILDNAWNNYVSECKREKRYINNFFILNNGHYGITSKMFYSFIFLPKIYIGRYSVEYRTSKAIPDYSYLAVYKEQ